MEFFVRNLQQYFNDYIIKIILYIGIYILNIFDNNKKDYEIVEYINNLNQVTFNTEDANEQHYEVPTQFFTNHLGKNLKYSSCEWDNNNLKNINEAEVYTISKYQKYLKLNELSDGDYVLKLVMVGGLFT